jgi:hypothetical protein
MDITIIDPNFEPSSDDFELYPTAIGRPLDAPYAPQAFRDFMDGRLKAPTRLFLRLPVSNREAYRGHRLLQHMPSPNGRLISLGEWPGPFLTFARTRPTIPPWTAAASC